MNPPIWRRALPLGALLLLIALILHLYWALRFYYRTDWDTALTSWTISSVIDSGKLIPDRGSVYSNGFTYQVLVSSLVYWTNWDVSYLQLAASPVLGIIPMAMLLLLYREFLPDSRMAVLAGMLALLQGDFLYITSRGSHEKVTIALQAMVLIAMIRVYTSSTRLTEIAPWVLLFYLGAFGLLSANVFFAGSFLATLTIAVAVALILEQRGLLRQERSFRPLMNTLLACLVIEFLIVFYIYPPSQSTMKLTNSILERLWLLLLSVGETTANSSISAVNPYTIATEAWVWPYSWVVLRFADVLIGVTAVLGWTQLLRARAWQVRPQYTLLLIFCLALGVQFVFAAAADRGGVGGISNMQVRIFPVVLLLCAPLSAYWLYGKVRSTGANARPRIRQAGLVMLPLMIVAVLVKSTNEPLLSNNWTFYMEGERLALGWLHDSPSLWPRLQWASWVGNDARLASVYFLYYVMPTNRMVPLQEGSNTNYDLMLTSPLVESQMIRSGRGVPDYAGGHRLYDNGGAQIYDIRRSLFSTPNSPLERVNLSAERGQ